MQWRAIVAAAVAAIVLGGCGFRSTSTPITMVEPTTSSTAAWSSTTIGVTTTVAPEVMTPPATSPPSTPAPAPPAPSSTSELARAQASGVPGSSSAVVIHSGCWGRTSSTHWGYYNYLGTGSTVTEPDGAVIAPGWVCLNPTQPSPYSSLVHELGHRYFWENGLWDRMIAEYGSFQRAGECFAAIWGATVFGSGGCPAEQQMQMRAEFGW